MDVDLSALGISREFVEANAMRFEVFTCGDAQSEKLALLLHGFPEHAYSWRYQIPMLAKMGFRVWAPNQRGYGNTTRPRAKADYRLEHLLDDVAALIDVSGAKSTMLVAHDWGGIVAWRFALRRVRPLERLVVMNLPHPTRFHQALQRPEQRKRSRYALFFQLPWLPEMLFRMRGARAIGEAFRGMAIDKSRFPDEVLDVYRAQALEAGALTAMLNWYRANLFRTTFAETAPILETPTLLIWGEEDTALGKEMTVGTDEFVHDLTLRYLPRVSHWVQQEAPEAVNEILAAWIEGREVPRFDAPAAGDQSAGSDTISR